MSRGPRKVLDSLPEVREPTLEREIRTHEVAYPPNAVVDKYGVLTSRHNTQTLPIELVELECCRHHEREFPVTDLARKEPEGIRSKAGIIQCVVLEVVKVKRNALAPTEMNR